MQHLAILPVLLPLFTGALLLLPPFKDALNRQRTFALLSIAAQLFIAAMLLMTAMQNGTQMYVLGGWQPPFGIVLVADRISTLLVLLCTLLCAGALLYACAGTDKAGQYFHPLFMFQVTGINGAFLTGDIFNLFVFFEVLLIASYALLVHGGGKQKTQAAVHYVILNLIGSSLFLFGLGILYGTLGTLNIADMAVKVRSLDEAEAIVAKAGGLLLLLVFGLKAALLPLHFWLPRTYASASAPVAALFAIMTKVGIYSIFRIHTLIFGAEAHFLADIALPWLWPMAMGTLAIGTLGVFASPTLRLMTANLVIISAGTLLITAALQTERATAAALYYMIHSTLITGALFLIADLISRQRGKAEDRFVKSRAIAQPRLLGFAFIIAALAIIGLPPLSGFVGKVLVMRAAESTAEIIWIWPLILVSSLMVLVALSRAGTTLFWRVTNAPSSEEKAHPFEVAGIALLLVVSPLLVIFGGAVTEYTAEAAHQLHDLTQSVDALLPGGN
ncbi:monovalent cation/H+ antiporter subunit D [Oceanospirillum maris]|uniref:monovalent cation/H+ antiporter subunit D n=1 Tax=Oceanospirillum maris TaxID=64977 RepID=UPI0004266119|nr:monovalent cation/H+ antiporter subunit D [Oceanospirillum maris]